MATRRCHDDQWQFGYTHWSLRKSTTATSISTVSQTRAYLQQPVELRSRVQLERQRSVRFAFAGGSRLTPRVDVYGQTEICSAFASAASCSDGYELVNPRLQWASPDNKWKVAVGGTNVGDEEYYLNKFDLTLFGQNTVEGQPGRPAEWYVTFGRNF